MDGQVSIPGQPHPPPLQHLGDAASLLAAQNMHQNVQNMQRLLYTYRTIAAHTIGGPSSTSLEAKPGQLPPTGGINGVYRQNSDNNNLVCPPNKKLTPLMYNTPWSLTAAAAAGIGERRRNSSSSSNGGASLATSTATAAARNSLLATLASAARNNDGESSSVVETDLEGHSIAAFNIGGELRLCLTQIIHLVLNNFPFTKINQACEELQIFCSTADPSQLNKLKRLKVLPVSTNQCGLITKSDAERLCSYILTPPSRDASSPPSTSAAASPPAAAADSPQSGACVRVQHNCFGKCVGSLHLSRVQEASGASQPDPCIECCECGEMLQPGKFVCHSHQPPDKGIVHWGFSRDNWPAYIQVWEDYSEEDKEEKEKIVNEFKSKFFNKLNSKRKSDENEEEQRKRLRETRDTKDGKDNQQDKQNHQNLTIPNIHPFEKVLHPAAALGQIVDPRQLFPWALVPHHNYIQSLAHIQLRIMLDQQQLQQQQQLQAQQQLHHLQQLPQHQQFGLHHQLANSRWPPLLAGNESRRLPDNLSPPVSQGKDGMSEHGGDLPVLPLLGHLHRTPHVFAPRPREHSPIHLGPRPRSGGESRDQSPTTPHRPRSSGGDQSPVSGSGSATRYMDQSPLSLLSRPREQSVSPVMSAAGSHHGGHASLHGGNRARDLTATPTSNSEESSSISRHQDTKPPVFDEAMVGVAAVLAASGLAEKSKLEVLSVVERLVDRLKRAEMEKVSAALQLKGMEERISSLEAELERNKNCSPTTTQSNTTTNNNNNNSSSSKQEDETSSDGGIESGTEVDGEIV